MADPALFLGPMLHAFGWSYDDYPKLANGTLAGHLLECSGQLTGGCFADPGKKEVEDLAGLGYPLADVWADGRVEVSKTPGSGGRLDVATCTEQLLYEMHDPSAYITPDCVLDASGVNFRQVGADRVALGGARGKPRTATYKVVVGYFDGYMGSGEMGFAGVNAVARAKLGIEVVKERLRRRGLTYEEMRIDLIGMNSLHGNDAGLCPEPYEVRLRIAAGLRTRRRPRRWGRRCAACTCRGRPGPAAGSISARGRFWR